MFIFVLYWSLLRSQNFGPTRNTSEKKFELTKYLREKILDPRRHDGTMTQYQDARDPQNLVHLT